MLTADGPKVLGYNVRFGDPECQPLLARLEGDLAQVMLDCVNGGLDPASLGYSSQTALGVVLTAKGYPRAYPKGLVIKGIERLRPAGRQGFPQRHGRQGSGADFQRRARALRHGSGPRLAAAQKAAYAAWKRSRSGGLLPHGHRRQGNPPPGKRKRPLRFRPLSPVAQCLKQTGWYHGACCYFDGVQVRRGKKSAPAWTC